MEKRISRKRRHTRRQRLLLELLVTITVAAGASVIAGETELAYYTARPSDEKYQVQTVSADEESARAFRSVLQAQALQESELPAPDRSIPSSSDVPEDEFIFVDPPAPETMVTEDVDAVVDQALTPVPVEEYFSEMVPEPVQEPSPLDAPNQMDAPMPARATSRPSLGAVAGSYSAAPNMIGDFFGGSFRQGSFLGSTVSLAGGDRRFKVAENVSPIPQDRVFFNFNHFHNALIDVNGVSRSLQRFTFGFEKTFFAGNTSFELRLPFASALNSLQTLGIPDTRNAELGNLAFAFKANLLSGRNWLLSGGTTMTVPTGDDFELFRGTTRELVVENEAVHLAPFLGWLVQPDRCCFAQGFIQADFDLNGNDVATNSRGFEGVLQDQNLLFIDASVGRWLHRSCNPCDCLTGVAALAELHYTTTLNDTDRVAGINNPFNRMDILNATAALHVQFRRTSVRVGGAAPLRNDEQRLFDAEVILQLNRNF